MRCCLGKSNSNPGPLDGVQNGGFQHEMTSMESTVGEDGEEIVAAPLPEETEAKQLLFTEAQILAMKGQRKQLRRLVETEPWVIGAADAADRTLLMYAAICDRHRVVAWLLQQGAQILRKDKIGRTALHWAVFKDAQRSLRALVRVAKKHRPTDWPTDADAASVLHFAARLQESDCLRILLNAVKSANWKEAEALTDRKGRTPLHWAAAAGQPHNLLLLAQNSALALNIDQVDEDGRTPLMWATTCLSPGGVACVQLLLQLAPWSISVQDTRGLSPLHLSVISDNEPALQLLLEAFAGKKEETLSRPDVLDKEFQTPLHWAAILGLQRMTELLLAAGAQPNLRDVHGASPIHYAAKNNFKDIIRLMLQARDLEDPVDEAGRSGLMWAAEAGATAAAAEILRLVPATDRRHADSRRRTALHLAAIAGQIRSVEMLLVRGWEVKATDDKGMSGALLAAAHGHSTILKLLLKAGADPAATDQHRRTAMHWAALGGHAYICQLLRKEYKVDPDCQDAGGRTPMHCAAFGGFVGCISVLLQGQADPCVADNSGYTALHLAGQEGHTEVVELLLSRGCPVNAIAIRYRPELPEDEQTDEECVTPFDLANLNGRAETAELLLGDGGLSYGALCQVAATKIQAVCRGRRTRKRTRTLRSDTFVTKL